MPHAIARHPRLIGILSRSAVAIAIAGIPYAPRSSAQSPAPRAQFDAASIRLDTEGGPYVFNGMASPGTYSARNQTLRNLIQEAYGVPSGRRNWLPFFAAAGQGVPIFGGPAWIGEDRWDITAKWNAAPAGRQITLVTIETAQSGMELMLRSLLEDRFQLKVHREKRNLPVYELTVAKTGKLRQSGCVTFDPAKPEPEPDQPPVDYCGASREGRKGMDWTLDGTGMKMAELADTLSYLIGDRIVIDRTGFTGTFDVHLRWTPVQGQPGANVPASPDDAGDSVFTVLRDQLGLNLKTGRAPVEVIVVDHVQRPSPN